MAMVVVVVVVIIKEENQILKDWLKMLNMDLVVKEVKEKMMLLHQLILVDFQQER